MPHGAMLDRMSHMKTQKTIYDKDLETSDRPEMISIAGWKSYKLKRCTVNTLSAERRFS
jgi:hypothetical protein